MVDGGRRCAATRVDGSPCRGLATASTFCWAHDPENRAKVASVRAAGGHGRARTARAGKLVPRSLRPVLATLFTALDEVHAGELTPQQGSSIAALAGAIVRTYTVGTMEERLQALEQAQTDAPVGRRA